MPRNAGVKAATGYSKRISWLRAADAVPLKVEYYGPQGSLLKIYSCSDIRQVDAKTGRYQPMRQAMRNAATGHTTLIEYSSFKTDVPVTADAFLPRALERPS